jgi:hypothetical protein
MSTTVKQTISNDKISTATITQYGKSASDLTLPEANHLFPKRIERSVEFGPKRIRSVILIM